MLMFETQKNLFTKGDLDFKWQFSQIPKIFILYFFLQMPSVQSWLHFDYQNLKILIYQSLVIIFLTREYFYFHLNWLENFIGLGVELICSLVEPSPGELAQQKRVKEQIKIVKVNKLTTLDLSNSNLKHIPQEIFGLTHLKELNLDNNEIRKIPQEIVNLNSLEVLCLNDNRLSAIPDFIGQISSLDVSINKRICYVKKRLL